MSIFPAPQQHDIQDAINRLIGLTSSKKRHYAAMKHAVRDLEETAADLRRYACALKVAEARYRAMFEHSSACVAVFEAAGNGEDFVVKEFNPGSYPLLTVRRPPAIVVVGKQATQQRGRRDTNIP
jgi:hypothetical protein